MEGKKRVVALLIKQRQSHYRHGTEAKICSMPNRRAIAIHPRFSYTEAVDYWPTENLERRAALSAGERMPLPLERDADGVVDMDEAYYERTN